MVDLVIQGGNKLSGTVIPSGNKNSVLPAICASLLTDELVTIKNVPDLIDVQKLVRVLRVVGARIRWDKKRQIMEINNSRVNQKAFNQNFSCRYAGVDFAFCPLLHRLKK